MKVFQGACLKTYLNKLEKRSNVENKKYSPLKIQLICLWVGRCISDDGKGIESHKLATTSWWHGACIGDVD